MRDIFPGPAKWLFTAALSNVLGSAALAQTTVTIEGVLDAFIGSVRNSGDAGRRVKLDSSGMTTSWIGFKGSEDLGSGLQANFALAGWIRPDTGESGRFPGDPLFSRAANVGLTGPFGAISLGRGQAPSTLPILRFNPFGNAPTFSPLAAHLNIPVLNATQWGNSLAGDTGWSNQIKYTTPTINDVTVNLHYQFGEAAGSNKGNVGANLLYMGNPLALTAVFQQVEVNNPVDVPGGAVKSVSGLRALRQTAWFIGASYDFKSAKLFGTYDQTAHDIALHDKTHSVGVTVPKGRNEILAAWAQTRRDGAGIPDQRRDTVSLGLVHKPSKRTNLYVVLMRDKITAFDSGSSVAAGIQHRF